MFFLNKRSNFEQKPHELSYRSNKLLYLKILFFKLETVEIQRIFFLKEISVQNNSSDSGEKFYYKYIMKSIIFRKFLIYFIKHNVFSFIRHDCYIISSLKGENHIKRLKNKFFLLHKLLLKHLKNMLSKFQNKILLEIFEKITTCTFKHE